MSNFFPHIIDIELTNRCNLNCIMCPRYPQRQNLGDMSEDLLTKILDETLHRPQKVYRLHGIGEPLLAPTLKTAINRIMSSSNNHFVDFITNGQLLTRDMGKFLLYQQLSQITISLGAATATTYQKIRGKTNFSAIVRNIITLIDENARLGSRSKIIVQLVKVDEATDEIEDFINFWRKFPVEIEIWHDFRDGRSNIDPACEKDLSPCKHLYEYIGITWHGEVRICCQDPTLMYRVGEMSKNSIEEIYNCPQMNELRDIHQRGTLDDMPICQYCSFRDDSHIYFNAVFH